MVNHREPVFRDKQFDKQHFDVYGRTAVPSPPPGLFERERPRSRPRCAVSHVALAALHAQCHHRRIPSVGVFCVGDRLRGIPRRRGKLNGVIHLLGGPVRDHRVERNLNFLALRGCRGHILGITAVRSGPPLPADALTALMAAE
jgi:hypothetical protein